MLTDNETTTIYTSTASKKHEFLNELDTIHAKTMEYMNNYEKICENIFSNSKKRLKISHERYLVIFNILKEFKIFAPNSTRIDLNLDEKPEKNDHNRIDLPSNEVLMNDSVLMFYNDLNCFVDGIAKFQKHVEENIIEEIFKETVRILDLQVKNAIEIIKKNSVTLEKKRESVLKRLIELKKNYNATINSTENGKRCMNDTADDLITYVNRLKALASSLALYGQQVLRYRDLAIELNYKYDYCVKEGIIEFSRALREYFGDVHNICFGRALQRVVAIDLQSNKSSSFELADLIIDKKQLDDILNYTSIDPNNLLNVINDFINPDYQSLFSMFSKNVYEFSESKDRKPDYVLLITLDYYFSVYRHNTSGGLEKIMSVPVETVKLNLNSKTNIIKCTYKEKGVFWDTSKTLSMSMDQKHADDLLLAHEFVTDIVKDLANPTSSETLRQLTREFKSSEFLNTNEKEYEQSISDQKTDADEILHSYISDIDHDNISVMNHTDIKSVILNIDDCNKPYDYTEKNEKKIINRPNTKENQTENVVFCGKDGIISENNCVLKEVEEVRNNLALDGDRNVGGNFQGKTL